MPLSSILDISLTTMTFSIAIFGAISLLGDPLYRRNSWGLALFLSVAAFDGLVALLRSWDGMSRVIWLGGLESLVACLYGPAIYIYTLTLTGKAPRKSRAAMLLLAPVLIAFIPYAAALTLPADVQLSMLVGAPIDKAAANTADAIMIAMQATFLTITFGFLIACWRALDENQRRLTMLFSSIEDRTLSWLRLVMIVIFLAWAWAALVVPLASYGLMAEWLGAIDASITLVWVSVLAYFGARQRPTLQEEPHGHQYAEAAADGPVAGGMDKYARSALDDARMQKLADRMMRLMEEKALYRDAGLSLRRLADHVGASPNYISQTLNDHLGVSFFDFINGLRVAEAERLLRETDSTVTEIALDVGFNSRSTFNAAIRKHRGMSPSQIRQQG